MSTKLHHGYRLRVAPSELFVFFDTTRASIDAQYRRRYYSLLVSLATDRADRFLRGEPAPADETASDPLGVHPLARAGLYLDAAQREIERTGQRNPAYDLACDVTIIADPANPADLYALFFAEYSGYVDVWSSLAGVESFAYWNNTDHPAELTDDEWDQRAATWDRVLRGCNAAPASLGATWSLLPGGVHQIAPWLGTADDDCLEPYRVARDVRAYAIAEREIWRETLAAAKLADDPDLRAGHLMRTIMDQRAVVQAAARQRAEAIAPTLVELSIADLRDLTDVAARTSTATR